MSDLQKLYKGILVNDPIAEILRRVGNYAWEQMTLLEQGEMKEQAATEYLTLRSALAEKDKRIADLEESLKIMADEYAKLESEKECQ